MMKRLYILGLSLALTIGAMGQNEITVHDDRIGQDEQIGLPEGMLASELDSLLHEWNAKNYLTFDENCEASTENPVFDKEVYITRLSHLPNIIDMPYNDVVQKYINLYSGRLRNSVAVLSLVPHGGHSSIDDCRFKVQTQIAADVEGR